MHVAKRNRAFTLVEILIVIVILGILAAIVVPQFTSAADEARGGNLATQISSIQNQIELFRARTGAYPTLAQMQAAPTDADKGSTMGILVDNNYLRSTPSNPAHPNPDPGDAADPAQAVADASAAGIGWVYDEATGEILATYYDELEGTVGTTHDWGD